MSLPLEILLVAAAVLLSGLYSGSETGSFGGLNRIRLRHRARAGVPGAATLQGLLSDHTRFVATMLVGTNLAGYVAAAILTARFGRVLGEEGLALPGGLVLAPDLAATLALLPFLFLFGEVLPKSLFYRRSNRWMESLARTGFLTLSVRLFRPATWVMDGLALLVRKLGGAREARSWSVHSRAALLRRLAEAAGAGELTRGQRRMAEAVLALGQVRLSEAMVPLERAFLLPADLRAGDFRARLAAAPLAPAPAPATPGAPGGAGDAAAGSRVPLHGEERGDLLGMVHFFDLVGADDDEPLRARMRPIARLPAGATLREALSELLASRQEIAAVADASGRAVGLVTIEDLAARILRAIPAAPPPPPAASPPR